MNILEFIYYYDRIIKFIRLILLKCKENEQSVIFSIINSIIIYLRFQHVFHLLMMLIFISFCVLNHYFI